MKRSLWLVLLVSVAIIAGCKSTYYSAWEKVGVYKRDILKKRVIEARDDQQAASQQFTDALTRLKSIYGFNGGDLEKEYDQLNSDYQRSVEKANAVHERIKQVETVANDLFDEWQKEIGEYSSETLREADRQKLQQTRERYDDLHTALKRAEQGMDPVLAQFHDQVIYLKHNLNAEAIGSLKGETDNIQADIGKLIADMNNSISQADQFVKALPQ